MNTRALKVDHDTERKTLRRLYGITVARMRDARGHTQESAAAAAQPDMSSQNWGRYETGMAAGITDPIMRRRLLTAIGATEEEFQAELARASGEDTQSSRLNRLAGAISNDDARQISPESRQAVFPLSEGDLIVTFPRHLTAEGRKEMKRYLDLLMMTADTD